MGWEDKLRELEAVLARVKDGNGTEGSALPSSTLAAAIALSPVREKGRASTPATLSSAGSLRSRAVDPRGAGRRFAGATAFSPEPDLGAHTGGGRVVDRDGASSLPFSPSASPATGSYSLRSTSPHASDGGLSTAVAQVLAQAVSQAVSNVESWQRRGEAQARLLSKLQVELVGRLSSDLETQLGQAVAEAASVPAPTAVAAEKEGESMEPEEVARWAAAAAVGVTGAPALPPSPSRSGLALKLGPAALELLKMAGWGEGGPPGPPPFPFTSALVTAVALAHAGHPDRLCGALSEAARTARQLRTETQLLRSVVDQVRAEHCRRMAVVEGDRDELRSQLISLGAPSASTTLALASPVQGTAPSPRAGFPHRHPALATPHHAEVRARTREVPTDRRPQSAGPRLAARQTEATPHLSRRRPRSTMPPATDGGRTAPSRAGVTPGRPSRSQLHPPEAASPPVALLRGTGLGAGGPKLAMTTKPLSSALLRAIGGRTGTRVPASRAADSPGAEERHRGRPKPRSKSVGIPGRLAPVEVARAGQEADGAAPSAHPAAIAAARIRAYRATRGAPAATTRATGTAAGLSAAMAALIAGSPPPAFRSPAQALGMRDLGSPMGAAVPPPPVPVAVVPAAVPPSLVAMLDRLRASNARLAAREQR